MKAGKEYELLIANLYRNLEPNAIVTHDDHIYDDPAKTKRQIDVSIKSKIAGVDILIIVEVKDYKHRADVQVVDKFKTVIENTKASKGIIICSKGFSKAALNKAQFYNIECLTVHSALNKNWADELRFPVKKIVHNFSLETDITLDIRSKQGKQVRVLVDTFSYDGYNIIGIADVVYDHIIAKMGWEFIKKEKKIRIDLKKIKLFHSFDDEMLPVEKGYLEIIYLDSTIKKFNIDPVNYLYSKDQINESGILHDLTISEEILDKIIDHKHENDNNINADPVMVVTTYNFNDMQFSLSKINFNFRGTIKGNYFLKNTKLIKDNQRGRDIIELEQILKGL